MDLLARTLAQHDNRKEVQKRRQLRMAQVRRQTMDWNKESNQEFKKAKSKEIQKIIDDLTDEAQQDLVQQIQEMIKYHDKGLKDVGSAHREVKKQPDYAREYQNTMAENRAKAKKRFNEALAIKRAEEAKRNEKTLRLKNIRTQIFQEAALKAKYLPRPIPSRPKKNPNRWMIPSQRPRAICVLDPKWTVRERKSRGLTSGAKVFSSRHSAISIPISERASDYLRETRRKAKQTKSSGKLSDGVYQKKSDPMASTSKVSQVPEYIELIEVHERRPRSPNRPQTGGQVLRNRSSYQTPGRNQPSPYLVKQHATIPLEAKRTMVLKTWPEATTSKLPGPSATQDNLASSYLKTKGFESNGQSGPVRSTSRPKYKEAMTHATPANEKSVLEILADALAPAPQPHGSSESSRSRRKRKHRKGKRRRSRTRSPKLVISKKDLEKIIQEIYSKQLQKQRNTDIDDSGQEDVSHDEPGPSSKVVKSSDKMKKRWTLDTGDESEPVHLISISQNKARDKVRVPTEKREEKAPPTTTSKRVDERALFESDSDGSIQSLESFAPKTGKQRESTERTTHGKSKSSNNSKSGRQPLVSGTDSRHRQIEPRQLREQQGTIRSSNQPQWKPILKVPSHIVQSKTSQTREYPVRSYTARNVSESRSRSQSRPGTTFSATKKGVRNPIAASRKIDEERPKRRLGVPSHIVPISNTKSTIETRESRKGRTNEDLKAPNKVAPEPRTSTTGNQSTSRRNLDSGTETEEAEKKGNGTQELKESAKQVQKKQQPVVDSAEDYHSDDSLHSIDWGYEGTEGNHAQYFDEVESGLQSPVAPASEARDNYHEGRTGTSPKDSSRKDKEKSYQRPKTKRNSSGSKHFQDLIQGTNVNNFQDLLNNEDEEGEHFHDIFESDEGSSSEEEEETIADGAEWSTSDVLYGKPAVKDEEEHADLIIFDELDDDERNIREEEKRPTTSTRRVSPSEARTKAPQFYDESGIRVINIEQVKKPKHHIQNQWNHRQYEQRKSVENKSETSPTSSSRRSVTQSINNRPFTRRRISFDDEKRDLELRTLHSLGLLAASLKNNMNDHSPGTADVVLPPVHKESRKSSGEEKEALPPAKSGKPISQQRSIPSSSTKDETEIDRPQRKNSLLEERWHLKKKKPSDTTREIADSSGPDTSDQSRRTSSEEDVFANEPSLSALPSVAILSPGDSAALQTDRQRILSVTSPEGSRVMKRYIKKLLGMRREYLEQIPTPPKTTTGTAVSMNTSAGQGSTFRSEPSILQPSTSTGRQVPKQPAFTRTNITIRTSSPKQNTHLTSIMESPGRTEGNEALQPLLSEHTTYYPTISEASSNSGSDLANFVVQIKPHPNPNTQTQSDNSTASPNRSLRTVLTSLTRHQREAMKAQNLLSSSVSTQASKHQESQGPDPDLKSSTEGSSSRSTDHQSSTSADEVVIQITAPENNRPPETEASTSRQRRPLPFSPTPSLQATINELVQHQQSFMRQEAKLRAPNIPHGLSNTNDIRQSRSHYAYRNRNFTPTSSESESSPENVQNRKKGNKKGSTSKKP